MAPSSSGQYPIGHLSLGGVQPHGVTEKALGLRRQTVAFLVFSGGLMGLMP